MAIIRDLILVAEAPDTIRAVAGAVDRSSDELRWERCETLEELELRLDHERIPTVIVDIGSPPERALRDLDPIINRYSESRFILLSDEASPALILRAMQAGARHLLRRDQISTDLLPVVRRCAMGRVSRNGSLGSIISVFTAGGGVGASTFAINLANELAQQSGQKALLIDLDCVHGAADTYLAVSAQFGIADILRDGDRIDAELIESTVVDAGTHLDVLLSPAAINFEAPAAPMFDHLSRLLYQARQLYTNTVIDAPRLPLNVTYTIARSSIVAYIVFEMNVRSIRIARNIYSALTARNVRPEFLIPVANRYRGRREAISLDKAQSAIGCERIATLSNDFRNVLECMNFGRTLADQAPRSALRRDICVCVDCVRSAIATRRQLSEDLQ